MQSADLGVLSIPAEGIGIWMPVLHHLEAALDVLKIPGLGALLHKSCTVFLLNC